MGLVDELGSGVRNIHKYGKLYFGYEPQIIEDDIFKISFQVTTQVTMQAIMLDKLKKQRIEQLIKYCKQPRTNQEIMDYLRFKNREYFRKEILTPLIEKNKIMLTMPDKPRSPKQRYISK